MTALTCDYRIIASLQASLRFDVLGRLDGMIMMLPSYIKSKYPTVT